MSTGPVLSFPALNKSHVPQRVDSVEKVAACKAFVRIESGDQRVLAALL
jgi:hypothetical protein